MMDIKGFIRLSLPFSSSTSTLIQTSDKAFSRPHTETHSIHNIHKQDPSTEFHHAYSTLPHPTNIHYPRTEAQKFRKKSVRSVCRSSTGIQKTNVLYQQALSKHQGPCLNHQLCTSRFTPKVMISARSFRVRLGSTIGEVCQVITTFPMKTNLSGTQRIARTGACYMSGKMILTMIMTKRSFFAS